MTKNELQAELKRLTAELAQTRATLENAPGARAAAGPARPVITLTPDDPPPAMEPDKGDLTPDYARWVLTKISLAEARSLYGGREQHLPGDVRLVLQSA